MNEKKNNAHRLAYALYQRADDPATVERLARILDYFPSQLAKDMNDLKEYLNALEAADPE